MEGVEKRIDVIATAIQFNGTVHDLAESDRDAIDLHVKARLAHA